MNMIGVKSLLIVESSVKVRTEKNIIPSGIGDLCKFIIVLDNDSVSGIVQGKCKWIIFFKCG